MTDRELLELAAKAAGLKIHVARQVERDEEGHANSGLWIVNGSTCWNPLTNDGDALRLAVKLGLKVSSYVYFSDKCQLSATATAAMPSGSSWIDQPIGRFPEYTESHVKHDPYAATRRAIVRAAAEIGKGVTQKAPSVDLPEDNYYKSLAEAEELERSKK
jgi:hypothetical protein